LALRMPRLYTRMCCPDGSAEKTSPYGATL
jgi:hypothetical protein